MKKKTLFIAICALLIIAALIILPSALRGYTVNKADKASELSVPAPFALYSGKDIGFSTRKAAASAGRTTLPAYITAMVSFWSPAQIKRA